MTVKLLRRGLKKNLNNNKPKEKVTKKKRGRPKGSKNKPRIEKPQPSPVVINKPRRGRPKGSKNKPKETLATSPPAVSKLAPKIVVEEEKQHPLVTAIAYLEKHMSPYEIQHYRSRANRLNLPMRTVMVQDILSIFNIQDTELKKKLKLIIE